MTAFSYQLYSSRNFPPMRETLKMLAQAGYSQVEGYGGIFDGNVDLDALKTDLDAAGLTMPTVHIGVDILRDDPSRAIEIAMTIGAKAVFGPYLDAPDRPTTKAGWQEFGAMLGEAAKPLQAAGLTVGWHNHDFEFQRLDGDLPMNLILDAAPELAVEFDVAWCVKGGEDPVAWMADYGARIHAAHIKDIAAQGEALDEDGWADVGAGVMDWPAYMAALKTTTACEYFIAEHDNPNDHQRFAINSIAAMRAL